METYLLEMAEQYAAKCNNCGDTSFDIQIEADFVYSRSHKFNREAHCLCWREKCPLGERTVNGEKYIVEMNRLCLNGDIPVFFCSKVTPKLWLEYLQKERKNG